MRKTITKQWLEKLNACCSKSDMQKAEEMKDVKKICKALSKHNRFSDANWLITRILSKMLLIKYAIYAAKQVLDIYEKKYPDDDRPRNAIKAAEKYLKNSSQKNKNTADAAAVAAYAAAAAAAVAAYDAAAYAAAAAAAVAAYAADAVAAAAADAVDAAAADAAYAAASALKTKIINYGLKLIYNN